MEKENVHDIILITDSIVAAKKIFESKIDPLQNIFIPVTSAVNVRLANSKAGIKPTTPLSAFDKENSIEFLLDSLYYLYNYYMVCALLSHAYHVTSCDMML